MILSVNDLTCGYSHEAVLTGLNLSVSAGECLCILGPNGVGKTTLFKTMLGLLPSLSGSVRIDNEDISQWDERKKAHYIAYIPQSHQPPFPYTVHQVVVMGRTAHLGLTSAPSRADHDLADQVLESLGLLHLRDKVYTRISGGERQMTLIARALTQDPYFLLMDEPTANLDFGNQGRVLREIRRLKEEGISIVMTTHTPDHAFLCEANVALIGKDDTMLYGSADEIVTEENMARVYGIPVCMTTASHNNQLIKGLVPLMETQETFPHTK